MEFFNHIRSSSHTGVEDAAGCERIFLSARDHALDKWAQLFRLRNGRRDALLEYKGAGEPAQKCRALALLTSQCSFFPVMPHTDLKIRNSKHEIRTGWHGFKFFRFEIFSVFDYGVGAYV